MKILAVDTCSHKCSVAITDGDKVLYSIVEDMARGHSENLFPMIETALKEANVNINDIGAFACSIGPGAFTGLRVGIASVKALSLATRKPVVGIKSADAIIEGIKPQEKHILVALESKRDDVYWQIFDKNKEPLNVMSVSLSSNVAEQLKDEDILVIGDGAIHFKDLLPNAEFDFDVSHPLPENICKLSADMIEKDMHHGTCVPLYLREADVSMPKKLIIPRIEK